MYLKMLFLLGSDFVYETTEQICERPLSLLFLFQLNYNIRPVFLKCSGALQGIRQIR